MYRSLVTSALIIASALALVAFTGTQALFVDSQTASGGVNAAPGNVDLRINDVGLPCGVTNVSENEFTFEAIENLMPGDTVTCEVELENEGSLPFEVNVTGADTSASELDVCDDTTDDFTVTLTKGTDTDGDDTLANAATVAAGAADTAFIEVSLSLAASNACQGLAAVVSVEFTATSIP
jgi:hypothetical protein